jgi:DNA-binding CsgD family transcriptional regulator
VLLWAQGKSNPEIAAILGSGEGTIRKHLEHVFAKLGVENRAAAAARALEVLMVPADGPGN